MNRRQFMRGLLATTAISGVGPFAAYMERVMARMRASASQSYEEVGDWIEPAHLSAVRAEMYRLGAAWLRPYRVVDDIGDF